MSEARTGARVGIDVGGTFTDVALEIGGRRFTSKVLTTTDDPAVACMQALEEGLSRAGAGPRDVGVIIHGTTLATNAILERKGRRPRWSPPRGSGTPSRWARRGGPSSTRSTSSSPGRWFPGGGGSRSRNG